MSGAILVACAHGTRDERGRAEVLAVIDQMRTARPELTVLDAYVDVHGPALADVVAGLPQRSVAVVVPLLLSLGYHVKVDIARAVRSRAGTVAAAPLGPDPVLAGLLVERLAEAGLRAEDAIVLAAAGSSNPQAAEDVERTAVMLGALVPQRIVPAYGASAEPSVPAAVAGLARELRGEGAGGRVLVASYLLASGHFHGRLGLAGASAVTEPLLPSPVIARIALARYDAAVTSLAIGEGV